MNKKVFHTLEYDKILELLSNHASSGRAREMCARLSPSCEMAKIHRALTETSDALSRIYKKGGINLSGIHDPGASMKRLQIGGSLSIPELLRLVSLLEAAKRARAYGRSDKGDAPADSLADYFSRLEPLTVLADEIKRCIISEDEISDDASSRLKSIRRSIASLNGRIRTQMNAMLNQAVTRGYLQDAVVTMRDGRYCLPVKAEAKNQVPGMIHDQSSSGSTLFIEPMTVVNLNNDLRELFLKEQEEIDVILADLSAQTAEYIPLIQEDFDILTTLDFIFAKADFALEYNGSVPILNEDGQINIKNGRHPLLDKQKVVPINIRLGGEFDQLVITGPNTGGKTVSLKTVGLLTLMGQSGLLIPAQDHSEIAIFHDIFADIGDEQSIEQSLSTFSSHMTNIIDILSRADSRSLVLFDELCAGTDPTEGAALAVSILTWFHTRGIHTVATTHYSEIKVYALTTEGVENACCEFDVNTLSPTYRLLIGIPGKSNAFAISRKLGLSAQIIDDAKERLTEHEQNFEEMLADIERDRVAIEQERLKIGRYKQEIENQKNNLKKRQERLENSREEILRKAREEANAILQEAKDAADEAIRSLNRYGSTREDIGKMEHERTKLREKLSENEKKRPADARTSPVRHKVPKNLKIGDSVMVLSMNLKGTVHTLPDAKGNLFVQMGILRSLVNIRDLILLEDDASLSSGASAKTGVGKLKMSKTASVSPEINLIGKTVDEAIFALDKYLDDAYLAHLSSVRIVHGKGTGALRNAIHSHLKRQKYIKSYHLGEFGEGDAGVTIAEFQ